MRKALLCLMLLMGFSIYSQSTHLKVDLIVTLTPSQYGSEYGYEVYIDNGEEVQKAPANFDSILKVIKIYEAQGLLLVHTTESNSIRLYFREKE